MIDILSSDESEQYSSVKRTPYYMLIVGNIKLYTHRSDSCVNPSLQEGVTFNLIIITFVTPMICYTCALSGWYINNYIQKRYLLRLTITYCNLSMMKR